MPINLDELWKETLARLQHEIPKSSFNAWMRNTKPVALVGNTLYVSLDSAFGREWIMARYAPDMVRILKMLTGNDYEIKMGSLEDFPEEVLEQHRVSQAEENESDSQSQSQMEEIATGVLNPRYTFHTFVVGNSNRFAHAAALAVAEAPARAYNPLFLYGGVGLGKTHLMQAIAHYVLEHNTAKKVVYVSSEKFTNDLINAIGKKSMGDFRNQYRNVDILMIDDIQFVAGKESTQEEFFHTFNALYEANKQIVISSDRPPREIPTLEERLRSRFEWGLITDIQPPDFETRVAILRRKADDEAFSIPDDVLELIADRIDSNIRELEGALNRVVAFARLNNHPITLDLAEQALRGILTPAKPKQISIATIQQAVCEFYGLKLQDMKSRKRTRAIAYPRQIAMYIARELTDASLPKIGEEFGNRDHTTVLHAYEKIQKELEKDAELQATIKELLNRIQAEQ